jgi:hypothetical protein
MFVSDTLWLYDIEWWSVCDLCMHVCLLCAFIFPAIESNDECAEEGGIFEYQEEGDQGQAIKASHLLVHIWILLCHYALLYSCLYFDALFSYIAMSLI